MSKRHADYCGCDICSAPAKSVDRFSSDKPRHRADKTMVTLLSVAGVLAVVLAFFFAPGTAGLHSAVRHGLGAAARSIAGSYHGEVPVAAPAAAELMPSLFSPQPVAELVTPAPLPTVLPPVAGPTPAPTVPVTPPPASSTPDSTPTVTDSPTPVPTVTDSPTPDPTVSDFVPASTDAPAPAATDSPSVAVP